MKVFTAYSNEEVLKIHSTEKVDLIITLLRLPGMGTTDLCFSDQDHSQPAQCLDVICSSEEEKDIALSERCRANAIMTRRSTLLLDKMQELLDIPSMAPAGCSSVFALRGIFWASRSSASRKISARRACLWGRTGTSNEATG